MKNSQEASQPNNRPSPSKNLAQSNLSPFQEKQDMFCFLRGEENPTMSRSFFSEMGLGKDIIKVTEAEPDICLEVFEALCHVLWPQIGEKASVSLRDAWTKFIGGSIFKGVLCSPEKLVGKKRLKDIKNSLAESEGENEVFEDLDGVVKAILNLKHELANYSGIIVQRKEIMISLDLIQGVYVSYRNKVIELVKVILEKESMDKNPMSEYHALENLLEPKAIMMSEIFTHHWAYRIPRNKAQKLLLYDGNRRRIKANSFDPSSHPVTALPEKSPQPLVYFKANGGTPIQPEKEFMLYSLYRHLQIPVPETALVILTNVFEENSDYFYAVQASEAVIGKSALEVCQNKEDFELEAYVSQVFGAFLTNPSDGSFKNFKYCPKKKSLISIDNDLVFKPELSGEDGRKIVNVKSILYLLPQIDLAIPEAVKTFFTTLDPHLTVFSWLKNFERKNQEYNLLFARLAFQKTRCIFQNLLPESELPSVAACLEKKALVDPDLHNDSFRPQIVVSKDLLSNVLEKLRIIETTLLNNRLVSTQILFEEISPVLGKYYRKLKLEFKDPEEALDAVWGEQKNGKYYSEILSLLSKEELDNTTHNKTESNENLLPETFLNEYKSKLISGQNPPLDKFIQRHSQRKMKNMLNLDLVLEELRFLIQEGLVNSHSPRDIVDFCFSLSKAERIEITSLLSNLPGAELKWLFTIEKYFLRAESDVPKGLKSIPITGAFMKQRILNLTESAKRYLFDEQGDLKKNGSLTGRSRVTCFPEKDPEFYLKQYPEFPGYEFASTLFMRELGIKYLPFNDLIIVNDSYPVLISQKVGGNPVHKIWDNPQAFNKLDPLQTGLLIIAAMLLNPEDGKEDNFILTPDGKFLIPIDNDHCFLPSTLQKDGNFWNRAAIPALQTKTLLFCLGEMKKTIPSEVKEKIIEINFDQFLTLWMSELDKVETRFNNLASQKQRADFLENNTVMRIPFYKQFIHNIHWKAHKIQSILKNTNDLTPFDLLKAIEPFAAKCYEDSFKPGYDLQSRFKAATDRLYKKVTIDGSRFSVLNTQSMIEIINISKEDLQNDAIFQRMGPVDILELLKELIRERRERAGKEQEILCELDEREEENKWIGLFGKPPVETALEDFFANPKEGLVLKGSKLIKTSKLLEFFGLTPDQGKSIRFLSLQNSPLLTHRTLRTLAKGCPNLEYLNVSGCIKLTEIFTTKEEWPLLARLEARDCFKLERVVSFSPMKILRIGTESKIEIFAEKSTLDIFTISFRANYCDLVLKKGENFEIKLLSQSMSTDDFLLNLLRGKDEFKKYFKEMKILLGTSPLSSGNDLGVFVTNVNLSKRSLQAGDIQRMVLLNLINLKGLNLAGNGRMSTESFGYLVQGNWPKLGFLDLSLNEFGKGGAQILAQGNWPLLETLHLEFTKITEVEIEVIVNQSNWIKLKSLNLHGNEIQDKGLQMLAQGNNWPLLEILNLQKTRITSVGIEAIVNKWPRLKELNLSENDINDQGLEVLSHRNWPLLEILNLENTKITKRRLLTFLLNHRFWNLKNVVFSSDGRSFSNSLLQKKCDQLEFLDLSSGQITQNEIEVIVHQCQWPKLKYLDLSQNIEINDETLLILAQGNWPLLETVDLSETKATKRGLLNFILNTSWPNIRILSSHSYKRNFEQILFKINWPLLKELDLSSSEMTQKEVEAIVKKGKWPKLRHLNLSDNPQINDESLQILAQGDWPLLETLDFDSINVTKKGLLNFALKINWPFIQEIIHFFGRKNFVQDLLENNWKLVQALDLSSSEITHKEIEAIVNRFKFPNLKSLNLWDNDISYEGFVTLSEGNWPLLEILNLGRTKMTAVGIEAIVKNSNWPQLKHVNLSQNVEINDEGLQILTQGDWPLLEVLNLGQIVLTQKRFLDLILKTNWLNLKEIICVSNRKNFAQTLFRSNWSVLEELDLSSCEITQNEIEAIVNMCCLPNLKSLNLSCNDICAEGFGVLSQGNWPRLEILNLNHTNIKLQDVETLVEKSSWPNLKEICFTEDGERDAIILRKWPDIELNID